MITLKEARALALNIVEYEGDQISIDFDLDRPQFSICPKCAAQVIQLSKGCSACGWNESQKHRRKKGEGTGFITTTILYYLI